MGIPIARQAHSLSNIMLAAVAVAVAVAAPMPDPYNIIANPNIMTNWHFWYHYVLSVVKFHCCNDSYWGLQNYSFAETFALESFAFELKIVQEILKMELQHHNNPLGQRMV
eukprot:NODE_489_length_7778_cov_0.178409.p6 type:complete len:111 gc:universal NODE_489_length_7778_cov_0.178409:6154-6486(+)